MRLAYETQQRCPKCGENEAYQVQGALYYTCEACSYAWVNNDERTNAGSKDD